MTGVLNNAGLTHLTELGSGTTPTTNDFDALVMGAGNDDPAAADTLEDVTQRTAASIGSAGVTMRLASGFPKMGDDDPRNTGRGTAVYTWRFERPAGSSFVASNAAVTNYAGGIPTETEPLLAHFKQSVFQKPDERLLVWVNAQAGEPPTLVMATEESIQNRRVRVQSFAARVRALQTWPAGSAIDDATTRVRTQPGVRVVTMADVPGVDGRALEVKDVVRFTRTEERQEASTGQWVPSKKTNVDPTGSVYGTYQYGDQRWRAPGGFNTLEAWDPPKGVSEGTFRLTYEMELCDRDKRVWRTIVEVA